MLGSKPAPWTWWQRYVYLVEILNLSYQLLNARLRRKPSRLSAVKQRMWSQGLHWNYKNIIIKMHFILTQFSFSVFFKEVDLLWVRNPVYFNFFNDIINFWPWPGFEPVISRIAGRRCPCILRHLTQLGLEAG